MFFRQILHDEKACASYLFGCPSAGEFAVVDAHADLVDEYVELAEARGARISAVLETHVQADHVSGLPELVERTGATVHLPTGADVDFEHRELADGESLTLGNTVIEAVATPGHAPAHHSYLVTDHRRGEEPWLVLTGDALLVGAAGRPDLHARGEHTVEEMAGQLYDSIHDRIFTLPDHVLVYPGHYSGSVCGAGLSGHPASTVGFERRNNRALKQPRDAFVTSLIGEIPPPPEDQAEIIAANRSGRRLASTA